MIFDGSASQTLNGTNSFHNLTVNNSHATDKVDASGSASLAVTNNLSITDGIFKSASDYANVTIGANGTLELSGDITVSGNWSNSGGVFTHNSHKVTLDGTSQDFSGSTTFYDLTKNVTSADTLAFQSGNRTTITNTLVLQGQSGQLMSLRSSSSGTQWEIDPQATRTISYVDVKDSYNVNDTLINPGTGSVNSFNNTNWSFADAPTATTNAASGIGATGATLNGTINANGTSTTVTFEYGATTAYGTTVTAAQSPVAGSTDTSVSKAITGLTADTTYHYRVVGTSAAGTVQGGDQTFATLAAAAETKADGAWSSTATWVGDVVPVSSQNATIKHAVTLDINPTVQGLTIDSGKSLTMGANSLIAQGASDINGTVSIGTGAFEADGTFGASGGAVTFTDAGNLRLGGTVASLGTFTRSTGTVTYDGAAQGVAAVNYYNLTFNGSGDKTLSGNIGIANVFTTTAGTFVHNGGTVAYNGASQTIPALDYSTLALSSVTEGATKTFADGTTKVDNDIEIESSDVTTSITLTGSSAAAVTVQVTNPGSGGTASRVFKINAPGETINISNMTIKGGDVTDGGGIYLSAGTLNLDAATIADSHADNVGGGISAWGGSITLTSSTISDNTSTSHGGGIFSNNVSLTLTNSTVEGNNSGNMGGGILAENSTLTLANSTVSGNSAADVGGGIAGFQASTLALTDCTVSGNKSSHATLASGVFVNNNSPLTLTNTVVSYNYKDNSGYADIAFDSGATIRGNYNVLGGYDLSGTSNTNYSYTSGKGAALFASYETIVTDTIYKPVIADNGGSTETVALAGDSIGGGTGVITGYYDDSGTTKYAFWDGSKWVKVEDGTTEATGVTEITTDQRGATRHGSPSIGAYELYTDYTTNGSGTSWNTAVNWNMYNGVTTPVATVAPSANNSTSIGVNHDMNVGADVSIDQTTVASEKTLTVEANQTLTVADGTGTDLTATGGLAVSANGILLINSGASVDSNGAFASSGTVSFDAASGGDDGTLNLAGASPTLGTLTRGQGTVTYDGADQSMDGQDYYNATIDGGGVKTLSGDATVENALALTSGLIALGNNDLTLGTAATVSGTPSASNMIVTNGTGVLKKLLSATGSFTFPVGDTAEYLPATLDFTSGTFAGGAYASLNVTNTKQPNNTSTTDYLNRYWSVTQSGITGFSCDTTFNYLADDVEGTEADIYGGQYKDSAWIVLSEVDEDNHSFQATITSFSDFTGVEGATPATQVNLTGPSTVNADVVSTVFTLTSQDADGDAANVTSDTIFSLFSNSTGTATFYSDAAGTSAITQLTIANGSSTATFYYKDTATGTPTVTATRTSGMSLGSDTHQITVNAGTASQVSLTGPSSVNAGAVSTVFTLTSQDGSGNTANVTSDTVFNLTSNTAGTATFYSDAAGTSVITQVTITNGSSTATFYYKDSNEGTPTITAAWNSGGTDLGSDTLPVTVNADAASKVNLTGPATVTADAVSTAFTLTSQDADGNASNVTGDTKFDLSSNSTDTVAFYSDAAGTSVITQVTITNGSSTATFYYKDSNEGTPTLTAAWNSGGTDLGLAKI